MDRFERIDLKMPFDHFKHLHSNMDRFESRMRKDTYLHSDNIYIPIWIDLKEETARNKKMFRVHLHSNMDRFERYISSFLIKLSRSFTFQYG